jgi:histone-lysine N-methyltransferase SETMAR
MDNQQLALLHDNASAQLSVLLKDFLSMNNVTTLEHPPYSPDMTPANFYPFLRLKSAVRGRRVYIATDIFKNATEELKRLSQNGFQERFQHFYSCWQKRIVAEGDYFEGNIA